MTVNVLNNSGETIPARAAMMLDGRDTDSPALSVTQPNHDGINEGIVFNGPTAIAIDAYGTGMEPDPAAIVLCATDNEDGEEAGSGETWGTRRNSWALHRGLPGFRAIKDGIDGKALVTKDRAQFARTVKIISGPYATDPVTSNYYLGSISKYESLAWVDGEQYVWVSDIDATALTVGNRYNVVCHPNNKPAINFNALEDNISQRPPVTGLWEQDTGSTDQGEWAEDTYYEADDYVQLSLMLATVKQGSGSGLSAIIVYTNGTFTVPAVGSTVSVTVDTVSTAAWMVINGTVVVSDGTHIVQGTITAIASTTAFTLRTEYILGGSSGQTMADNAKVIISTAMADASSSRRGAVNTTAQTFAGGKTFNDGVQAYVTSNLTAYPKSTFSGASYGSSAAAMYCEQSSTVWVEGSIVWENLYTAGNPPMFMIRVPGAAGATLDPCFSLLDKSGAGPYYGAWATVSGMVFKGGLYISGSFSGTAASVGLGNVENTALSTWGGTANITAVGTLSTGTWQATAIDDAYISSAATWNATSSATSGTNSGDQTAATTPYTPAVSADWNGADPTNVADALDRCAALLATLNGGTGP